MILLGERVSLLDFATGDGTTDDSVGVQTAIDYCATNGQTLFVPDNRFVVANVSLRSGLSMIGSNPNAHQFKLKGGANTDMFTSATIDSADDIVLRDLGFDGNKAENPKAGTILHVKGDRPTLVNLLLRDAPRTALLTENDPTGRLYGVEGHFERITIDAPYGHGWDHQGPNDSTAISVHIIDPSSGLHHGYCGIVLSRFGSAKFIGSHVWNRATTSAIPRNPAAAILIQNSGNTFSCCDFECGNVAVYLDHTATINAFSACKSYAPDGPIVIACFGSLNKYDGMILIADVGFDAIAIQLGDGTHSCFGNVFDVITADTKAGDVDISGSSGGNRVVVTGWRSFPNAPTVIGYPHPTDEINILHTGLSASSYRKLRV